MKLNLSEWASVAEVVSGIAVVVTLVFLVIGIESNTQATRASVYEEISGGLNEFNLVLINDPELAELWSDRAFVSLDSLDRKDAERLIYMNRVIFRNMDSACFSFVNGSLGINQWQRFRDAACRNYPNPDNENREVLMPLWERTTGIISHEFVEYLEHACAD